RALEEGSFELHLQPKFATSDGIRLIGAEALLRLTDAELGPISPAEFIPVAEIDGLVSAIDLEVMRLAGALMTGWAARGIALPLAVNLNATTLDEPGHADLAERLLLAVESSASGSEGREPVAEVQINADSGSGVSASNEPERQTLSGAALRYVDWVLPGVLAMNIMFSSLWGVGWVIVRYRKNGVLRRLKATPLSPWEFLTAQVLSRLLVVLGASLIVYLGAAWLLDVPMRGSYLALALVYVAGSLCLISLGLIIAARLRTEELADGLLNLLSWPMLLLSGVWFSMEGTSALAQWVSQALPLTHLVAAARAVMIDGAGVVEVLPEIGVLLALAVAFLTLATWMFRWE
ncbi:EAL domain-containing protein, partial [Candidatus Falkowbacteria bacterium]|nr:EAL domain-containing protein [Candidatus Falkowbacteria bacterium]